MNVLLVGINTLMPYSMLFAAKSILLRDFPPFIYYSAVLLEAPWLYCMILFIRQNVSADTYFLYHFIIDLHNKIKTSCRIAQDSASEVAEASTQRHEPASRLKVFEPGDLVMVLLRQSNNKLVLQIQGPLEVIKKQSAVNYIIDLGHRYTNLHVNFLRKYYPRKDSVPVSANVASSLSNNGVPTSNNSLTETRDIDRSSLFATLPFNQCYATDTCLLSPLLTNCRMKSYS
ncbi:reverse transcriptase [Plakobranchus ocellatus]|uniref:Reverse transcriptase n=1 Tax=Plakobranchus ocellatus TaxID=259542 RepID=A0AAV4DCD4_9GAST|nr:reverse transcriptase [Plakobranchus ocellatus]